MTTLLLGANSDIAKQIALSLSQTDDLILASRSTKDLAIFCKQNNIKASVVNFDAENFNTHQDFFSKHQNIEQVICAFGYLGNHDLAQQEFSEAQKIINTNFTGAVSILNLYAQLFEKKQKGTIVGISSVAADRGRQSNYFYGSAKAGFESYLSGLRNKLHSKGVHVLTVKPGFVNTKMLNGISTPNFLTSSPEQAAKKIIKAIKNKRNIVYISWKWYWVMAIIKSIPEAIFKKMSL